jgi:hypothetical protein
VCHARYRDTLCDTLCKSHETSETLRIIMESGSSRRLERADSLGIDHSRVLEEVQESSKPTGVWLVVKISTGTTQAGILTVGKALPWNVAFDELSSKHLDSLFGWSTKEEDSYGLRTSFLEFKTKKSNYMYSTIVEFSLPISFTKTPLQNERETKAGLVAFDSFMSSLAFSRFIQEYTTYWHLMLLVVVRQSETQQYYH